MSGILDKVGRLAYEIVNAINADFSDYKGVTLRFEVKRLPNGDVDTRNHYLAMGNVGEPVLKPKRSKSMAVLKAAKRNKLPKSDFGLPGTRKYPMNDKAHAANAKARATQMVEKGKLSPASASKIKAKANKILGKKKGK